MDEAVPQPDTSTPVVPDAAQIASVQEWTAQRDRFVEASLPQGDGDDGTASPAPAASASPPCSTSKPCPACGR